MAITFVGEYHFPTTDNANDTGTSLTFDKDAAIVGSPASGDFVMMFAVARSQTGTPAGWSVTTTGGQSWTEVHDAQDEMDNALYWCIFDGTWTADPVIDLPGSVAAPRLLWVVILRGVDNSTPFDVTFTWATDSDTSFNIADFNTNTNGAWAFGLAGSVDNNTWTVNNSFVSPNGDSNIDWLTQGGSDASHVVCRKEIATAGSVGAFTMTQATLGADVGFKVFGAIKPAGAGGDQDLTGSLFTKAGTFPTGTILATYDLTGTLFTRAGTFPTGTISTTYDLSGTTFQKASTFPQGTVALEGGDQSLTGATFTKAGTFPQGAVLGVYDLSGTTFSKAPTFPQGAITTVNTLTGTLFTKAGTFPQGTISQEGGPQSLTGTLFTKAGTFPQGAITTTYDLTGVLFTRSPTFPQGAVTAGAVTLTGVVFQKPGTFPLGVVSQGFLADPVKGPTRKTVLAGPNASEELVGAPRAVRIGAGKNSTEEL